MWTEDPGLSRNPAGPRDWIRPAEASSLLFADSHCRLSRLYCVTNQIKSLLVFFFPIRSLTEPWLITAPHPILVSMQSGKHYFTNSGHTMTGIGLSDLQAAPIIILAIIQRYMFSIFRKENRESENKNKNPLIHDLTFLSIIPQTKILLGIIGMADWDSNTQYSLESSIPRISQPHPYQLQLP